MRNNGPIQVQHWQFSVVRATEKAAREIVVGEIVEASPPPESDARVFASTEPRNKPAVSSQSTKAFQTGSD